MGGFEACPCLHLEFEEWTKKRIPNPIKPKKIFIPQKNRPKNVNEKIIDNYFKSNRDSMRNSFESKYVFCAENDVNNIDTLIPKINSNQKMKAGVDTKTETETETEIGIEAEVTLTSEIDTSGTNEQCVRWTDPPCVGQFTPIRMVEDSDIIKRFEHIPCLAGDFVLWDYRIPHSNSYKNTSKQTREAVYIGFLPNIQLNQEYIASQLVRYKAGMVPQDQWHSHNEPQQCNYPFSSLGRKLMGLDPWV